MNKCRGFTLLELMVTLVIAVILVTVAVPGFSNLIRNNQAAAQANELLTALKIARNEALKRRTRVSVCSRANPRTTPETCAGNTNWATGWLVFEDPNNNGVFDAGEELIRVGDITAGNATLTATANDISYLSNGLSSGTMTFTLTPGDCRGNQKKMIRVNVTGRARVDEEACP
jgi:type IV fimbrial biogenesis protein FimT